MNRENPYMELINPEVGDQLIPVDPECYKLSVQDFIEVVEDAKTHGIAVQYVGGKLYYTYNTL